MTPTRISLALIAAFIAAPVLAAPTPSSYAINSAPTSTTGQYNWDNSSAAKYGTGGTNYGNTYTWATGIGGTGPSVTASAWGSTNYYASGNSGALSATGGTIQKAWIGNYDPNGLGITSQSTTANSELNGSFNPDASSPNYEHAIDNVGSYESMMFSFGSAVTLNSVSIGFKGADADASVFVYTGSGAPPTLAGQTYASLLTSGWTLAGNILDMQVGSNNFANSYSSKYWMVGAYMAVGGNSSSYVGNDSFKISGLSVTPSVSIPEPDSVALFGVAALGLFLARRRKAVAV